MPEPDPELEPDCDAEALDAALVEAALDAALVEAALDAALDAALVDATLVAALVDATLVAALVDPTLVAGADDALAVVVSEPEPLWAATRLIASTAAVTRTLRMSVAGVGGR